MKYQNRVVGNAVVVVSARKLRANASTVIREKAAARSSAILMHALAHTIQRRTAISEGIIDQSLMEEAQGRGVVVIEVNEEDDKVDMAVVARKTAAEVREAKQQNSAIRTMIDLLMIEIAVMVDTETVMAMIIALTVEEVGVVVEEEIVKVIEALVEDIVEADAVDVVSTMMSVVVIVMVIVIMVIARTVLCRTMRTRTHMVLHMEVLTALICTAKRMLKKTTSVAMTLSQATMDSIIGMWTSTSM
jgi:hypothetical protein